MNIQNICNLIGLVINMVGAYMMHHYTPKVSSQLFLFTDAEYKKMREQDVYKNRRIRFGMLLLFIGFVFQFAALFL